MRTKTRDWAATMPSAAPQSEPRSEPLMEGATVLVVRLSAMGDILFALETVAALHRERPDLVVDMLVDDRWAGLVRGHPHLRKVLTHPRTRPLGIPQHLLRMRRLRYDAVLDLHGIQKSAWNVWAVRSPRKLGFAPPGSREGAHRVYSEVIELPTPLPHRADRGGHLLKALGLSGAMAQPAVPRPDRPVTVPWAKGGLRVLLQPDTSGFATFKRWPTERFAELARALLEDGCSVVVGHGPGQGELAEAIAAGAPGVRVLDGSTLGLIGYGEALASADIVVAADTGPLHLAAARGTRVVALFGPKDPALYGPRGDQWDTPASPGGAAADPGGSRHRLLYHDVPCRPCKRRDCPAPLCVRSISIAEALSAVRELGEAVHTSRRT